MTYNITFSVKVEQDLLRLAKSEPKVFAKANRFIKELETHPKTGWGHPEPLKGMPDNDGAGNLQRSTDLFTAFLRLKSMWKYSRHTAIITTNKPSITPSPLP